MNRPIKMLFIAANPKDTDRLRLDEEIRGIQEALRRAEFRDCFDLEQHWAVRVPDLQELLLRYKPDIVHFSGHGSLQSQIILEDSDGASRPLSPQALSRVFAVLKDNLRCVVLNACYSEQQARGIAEHIDCVIGMSKAIGDQAAISFAAAFYQALGYGRNVQTAFELGCSQIDLEGLQEQDTPQLLATSTAPHKVCFVESQPGRRRQYRVQRWIALAAIVAIIVAGFAVLPGWWNEMEFDRNPFATEDFGILVLRIGGDSNDNGLQHILVTSLNTELSKNVTLRNIEVRGSQRSFDEGRYDREESHARAREIGRKWNADLVIWGNKLSSPGKEKFHARLTVVDDRSMALARLGNPPISMMNLDLDEISQDKKPIFLAHFVSGVAAYQDSNYAKALQHFKNARTYLYDMASENLARYFIANTLYLQDSVQSSISEFEQVITSLRDSVNHAELFLHAANNLGVVLLYEHDLKRALEYLGEGIKACNEPAYETSICDHILYNLADASIEAGQLREATDFLNTAIQQRQQHPIDAEDRHVHYNFLASASQNMVYAYAKLGDRNQEGKTDLYYGKADSVWQKYSHWVEQLPTDVPFNKTWASYHRNRARIAIWKKEWDRALAILDEAQKFDPFEPKLFELLAAAYMGRGDAYQGGVYMNKFQDRIRELVKSPEAQGIQIREAIGYIGKMAR